MPLESSLESSLEEMQVISRPHPSYYLLHKYWGRKSYSLLDSYITLFTKPGDTVLDPFMGSGGVIIESNKLKRMSIGVDINPMACFIVSETLKKNPNADDVRAAFEYVINKIPQEVHDLAQTYDDDGNRYPIDNAIWVDGQLSRIKYYVNRVKKIKDADDNDRVVLEKAQELLNKYTKDGTVSYPKHEIMKFVRRNGKITIDELFSARNLLIVAFYLKGVQSIADKSLRDSLTLIFSSALPNISSMIPGDLKNVTGKSGWQISKFWVPGIHTEKNVIASLRLRLEKYIKGKTEMAAYTTDTDYRILNHSCENLRDVVSSSVDYVFTDPPYGDSIAYLALSSFWSSWLHENVDYNNEIIYDPYRNKRESDYSLRLAVAFKEVHRVLKDNKYMSFTFHNRHVKFWKIIIDAVMMAGFELVNVKWVNQAVASGTQGINRKNTLTGDFVYTFRKMPKSTFVDEQRNGEEIIDTTLHNLLKDHPYIQTSRLYEDLIPTLVHAHAYYDSHGKILNIDKYISTRYTYAQQEDGKYGWTL